MDREERTGRRGQGSGDREERTGRRGQGGSDREEGTGRSAGSNLDPALRLPRLRPFPEEHLW